MCQLLSSLLFLLLPLFDFSQSAQIIPLLQRAPPVSRTAESIAYRTCTALDEIKIRKGAGGFCELSQEKMTMFSQNRSKERYTHSWLKLRNAWTTTQPGSGRGEGPEEPEREDTALPHILLKFIQQNQQESFQLPGNYRVADCPSSFGMYFTLNRTTGNYRAA